MKANEPFLQLFFLRPSTADRLLRNMRFDMSPSSRSFVLSTLAASAFAITLGSASRASAADTAPAPAPAAQTQIRVTSDRENTTLLRLAGAGTGYGSVGGYNVAVAFENYEPLCTAPCSVGADPNGIYQIAGEGITPSGKFRLSNPNDVDLRVHAGSSSKRWWGWTSTAFGAGFLTAGGTMLLLGALTDPKADSPDYASEKDRASTYKNIGYIGLGTGAALLTLGIVLIATSGTSVTTASGQDVARRAPHRPGKLSLTPNGFTF